MSLFRDALQRGFYEAGKTNGMNNDFHNGNSPFEDTATPDRDTMRSRGRWLHENNGIISGIDHAIKVNSVGNGFKLLMNTGDEKIDKIIVDHYEEWEKHSDVTNRQHYGDMQGLILGQRMQDGEILINKKIRPEKKHKLHPLQLQLIEADRFDIGMYNTSPNSIAGIDVDTVGAPTHYKFNDGLFNTVKLRAEDVIHYFKMENRATQYRGLSEYKQVIIDLRNFAGYQSSTVASARARSNIAYAVETDSPAGSMNPLARDESTGQKIQQINGVFLQYLRKGEKLTQFSPSIDGAEYGEFVRSVVRLIAVGRKVSYELAFRDYSQVNFASARASIIQDHKRFSNEQWHMATYILNPIFEAWMHANVLAGNFKGLSADYYFRNKNKFKPGWVPPLREWIDPIKDMKALQMEIDMSLKSNSEAAASRGKTLKDIVDQKQKDNELLKSAGILTEEVKSA